MFHIDITITQNCIFMVLRSFSIICAHEYGKILSKYSIHNLWSNTDDLKSSLWRHFCGHSDFLVEYEL